MTGSSQLFLLLCGVVFFVLILFLLFQNKISERPSLLWLGGGIGILIISGDPAILDHLATWIGIAYPPSLLFFLSTLILLAMNLTQSIEMTKLQRRITALTQHVALLEVNIDEKDISDGSVNGEAKEVSSDRKVL